MQPLNPMVFDTLIPIPKKRVFRPRSDFHKYIHPTVMSITSSAEALLCVIAGGAGTLTGPIIGAFLVMILKNYVSGYVERWNMLLGADFVFIVLFMPSGITPWVADKISRLRNTTK